MPSLNHCVLLRHVGVNNLPKVVTRQRRGRESQPASCKSDALATLRELQQDVGGGVPKCQKKIEWTDALTEDLVDLYRQEKRLWKISLPSYSDRNVLY